MRVILTVIIIVSLGSSFAQSKISARKIEFYYEHPSGEIEDLRADNCVHHFFFPDEGPAILFIEVECEGRIIYTKRYNITGLKLASGNVITYPGKDGETWKIDYTNDLIIHTFYYPQINLKSVAKYQFSTM